MKLIEKVEIGKSFTHIDKDGRLVVPICYRKALKVKAGEKVLLRLENGTLQIIPLQQAVSMAQQIVRQYAPEKTMLADELMAARRAEA